MSVGLMGVRQAIMALVLMACCGQVWGGQGQVIGQDGNVRSDNKTQSAKQHVTHHNNLLNAHHGTEDFDQKFNEFLQSDAYSKKVRQGYWKQNKSDDVKTSKWVDRLVAFGEFFSGISRGVAVFLKVVLIGLLLWACVWLYKRRQFWLERLPSWQAKTARVTSYRDVRPFAMPLPDDDKLAIMMEQCIDRGAYREALSLLYRASLHKIELAYDVGIAESQTEGQCQALLATTTAKMVERAFFARVVELWQASAYGDRPSEPAVLRQLLQDWQRLYRGQTDDV